MNIDIKEIATVTMILFAVIDIIGSIPIIISLRQRVGELQSEKASIVSLVIMIAFLFIGQSILKLIGIDVSDFAIAGSLILFVLALEMILGIKIHKDEAPHTASIVPLAFPLIAGTGTLTTLLSLRAEYSLTSIIISICINTIFVFLVLKNTKRIESFLGISGIAVLHKVLGVILLAIAIKLFRSHTGL